MKSFNIFLVVMLLAVASMGQDLIVVGGGSFSNMLARDDDEIYSGDYSFKPGVHFGLMGEVEISDNLSFLPGVILSTKGYKKVKKDDDSKMVTKLNLYYFDIPLQMKATFEKDAFNYFGIFGVYAGVGVAGKSSWTLKDDEDELNGSSTIEWGNDKYEDDLKRPDYGISLGGGIEISNLLLGLTYDLGLANISSYQDYGSRIKNRVIKFSVGYKIDMQ